MILQFYILSIHKINKMIRYVSEEQINLYPLHSARKHISDQKQSNALLPAVQMPEEICNSTMALKSLKKSLDHSVMLKARLSVLQIHQEKNEFKAQINEQRYMFHQQMRDEMQKQRKEKARHLNKVLQKLHQTQQQARQDRLDHENNLKKAQSFINRSKVNDYRTTKEKEEEIQKSLSQFKREEADRKKQKNQSIREYERMQKSNVKQFIQNKKMELKINDTLQSIKLSRAQEQKKKQIEQLNKLESLMLERQARSRMVSQQSAKKLKKLLSIKKPVSTSHTTKLPSINQDKKQLSEQDLLIM